MSVDGKEGRGRRTPPEDDRPAGRRVREEVSHHLAELQAWLEAEGMSAEEARAEARRRVGDPGRIERDTRAARRSVASDGARRGRRWPGGSVGRGWLEGLRLDVLQAFRSLRRTPTFAVVVVLTLSLALGASIATFGVVWDVLLRPLDLRDPDSLVMLLEHMPETGVGDMPTSAGTFQDWRRELTTVRDLIGWQWDSRTWEHPERPEELLAVQVSGDLFEVLGIRPAMGRTLRRNDEVEGAPATSVMISYDLWSRRFGGDPGVVGREIPVDGVGREIVGVTPPRLDVIGSQAQIFEPSPLVPENPTNRGNRIVHAVGRLAPGASVEAASAEVAALTEQIAATHPTSARGWSAEAEPLTEHLLGAVGPRLNVASIAVGLLLLVAAVNVANLLLVRSTDRRREMAVRAALGAGRHRLVRMSLVESLLLGLLGGAGGLAVAAGLQRWLASTQGDAFPRALEAGVPPPALAFAAGLATLVGLAIGVFPAVRSAESAVAELTRGTADEPGGGVASRPRHAMVVVQVGVTVVLLVGAGLLVRTVLAIGGVDVGFDPEGVVAARVVADARRHPRGEEQQVYYEELLRQVRAIPGAEAAGLTSALPMDPIAANFDLPTRADPATEWDAARQVDFRIVGPGYMEALGFRLVEGRFFDDRDRDGPPTAIVNRSAAEALWPGQSAVGEGVQNVWRQDGFSEVVGVVEDTRFYGPMEAPRSELFMPFGQVGFDFMTVVLKARGDPATLQEQLERAFVEVDPLLPPQDLFAVETLVEAAASTERFYALLLSGFALGALGLAAAGVYGVLAYTVRLRTREMGVRLALGASRAEVTAMVVRRGLGLAAIGVVLGLAASVPSTRLVAGMLFGVEPLDPVTLGGVAMLLVTVAAGACLWPALRASRLDPARVLRDE